MKKLYFEGAGMFGCRDTAGEHGEIIPAEYLAGKQ